MIAVFVWHVDVIKLAFLAILLVAFVIAVIREWWAVRRDRRDK